nr:reverse transcriptase domain-containing protein [Tanacetum cinerariifolium]
NIAKTQSKATLNEPNPQGEGSGSGLRMEHEIEFTDLIPKTPHDSPLSGGHTLGSDEGSMTLKELIVLCTTLSQKVLDLEKVKYAQAKEGRKNLKSQQKFQDIDDLVDEEVIVKDKDSGEKGGNTAEKFSTARLDISVARPEVSAAEPKTTPTTTTLFNNKDVTIADTLIITTLQPLPTIGLIDKGKDILQEPKPVKKTKKNDQDQIERDVKVALRIQVVLDEEVRTKKERQKEASKAALAGLYDEVQAQINVDHELAARLTHEEQEKYIVEERSKLLAEFFKRRKKQLAKERAETIKSKPPTKTQLRNLMMTYLKHTCRFNHAQLKSRSFDEIQKLYTKEHKWVDAFVPIGSEEDGKRVRNRKKRASSKQKSPKKQKANDQESVNSDKELRICLKKLGTIEAGDVHVYKLTRLDGSYRHFLTFFKILEVLDRQDVLDLHKIVMERFLANDPEEKRYPLTKEILEKMLSWRLEAKTKKLIQETIEKIVQIKQGMQAAHDRQQSYADLKRKPMEFQVEDKVMLKVSPWKGVVRFRKRGKLNPSYVGPFKGNDPGKLRATPDLLIRKSASTPIDTEKTLMKDIDGKDVDVHIYRSMIGFLMYLTSSRPDIMFAKIYNWRMLIPRMQIDLLAVQEATVVAASSTKAEYVAAASCCAQVNDVNRLQALVDKKKVVVTEAAIREVLRLDDAEGVDCLPNEEIFVKLARMGDDTTAYGEVPTVYQEPSIPSPTLPTPSPQPPQDLPSISKVQHTPPQSPQAQPQPQPQPQPQQTAYFPMSLLQEALDAYDALTRRVDQLEYDKVAQALKIKKLKRRVKKLKKGNRVRVLKLRRLKRVGTSQRVDTSDDTVTDDESNQGRIIDEMDKDDDVVLMDDKEEDKKEEEAKVVKDDQVQGRQVESQAKIYKIDLDHASKVLSMQEDKPAEVHEVVDVVTTAKLITEVVTATSETVTATSITISTTEPQVPAAPTKVATAPSKRRKGVVIRDPEKESTTSSIIPAKTKSKDKGKGIMVEEPKPLKKKQHVEMDEEYARKLHAGLNKDIDWDVAI